MTSDKTQGEGNRLIAEGNLSIMIFDGWKKESRQTFDPDHNTQNPGSNTYYVYVKNGREVRPEDIEFDIVYHQSWDALMPVLKKIGDLQSKKESVALWDNIVVGLSIISIKLTWRFAIEYIQWYNTNSK